MSKSGKSDKDIVQQVVAEYQEDKIWTAFDQLNLESPFSAADQEEIKKFVQDMKDAANDNEKKAKLVSQASDLVKKILKVAAAA